VVDLLLDRLPWAATSWSARASLSAIRPLYPGGHDEPEEGELRPATARPFCLVRRDPGITAHQARWAILERTVQFESDPEGFRAEWEPYEQQLSRDIARARELLSRVTYQSGDLYTIAELTTSFEVDGHRADMSF